MDFSFNEEQTLLEDSVARFVQNDYGFEDRQKVVKSEDGFSTEKWQIFAELGWVFWECGRDEPYRGGCSKRLLRDSSFRAQHVDSRNPLGNVKNYGKENPSSRKTACSAERISLHSAGFPSSKPSK